MKQMGVFKRDMSLIHTRTYNKNNTTNDHTENHFPHSTMIEGGAATVRMGLVMKKLCATQGRGCVLEGERLRVVTCETAMNSASIATRRPANSCKYIILNIYFSASTRDAPPQGEPDHL